jgi:hypothetical protein
MEKSTVAWDTELDEDEEDFWAGLDEDDSFYKDVMQVEKWQAEKDGPAQ